MQRRHGPRSAGTSGPTIATPSRTPTALLDLAHENFIPLRHKVAGTDNVVRWTSHPRGGHFAALEVPELLAADVRAFFRA